MAVSASEGHGNLSAEGHHRSSRLNLLVGERKIVDTDLGESETGIHVGNPDQRQDQDGAALLVPPDEQFDEITTSS